MAGWWWREIEAEQRRRALGAMALTVEVATALVVEQRLVEQRTGRPGEPQPGEERGRPNAVEAAGASVCRTR